jgi:hypothetical protein
MLNQIGMFVGCLCVLGGATLVYAGLSLSDASQTMELLAGATLFTLGLILFIPMVKGWLELRRYHRG